MGGRDGGRPRISGTSRNIPIVRKLYDERRTRLGRRPGVMMRIGVQTGIRQRHRAHRIVDWYSSFKDFAGPGATVTASITAAGVAGYFAYQQAKTAKRQAETSLDQLRFNLFEKRYAVYEEIKQLIKLVIDEPPPPDLFRAIERHSLPWTRRYSFFLRQRANCLRRSEPTVGPFLRRGFTLKGAIFKPSKPSLNCFISSGSTSRRCPSASATNCASPRRDSGSPAFL